MLDELETKILQECCELNEPLTLSVESKGKQFIYRSRFLSVDFKKKFIIIDEPSPETHDAQPLSRGEMFEGYFAFKKFRYLIESRILGHSKFQIQDNEILAFVVKLPGQLKDGDKREYFRVESGMRPPVDVKFNIYKNGNDTPLMSAIIEGKVEEFSGDMVDISGGGFSMRSKLGGIPLNLENGDIINACFKLKDNMDEMEIWSEVRNSRRYKNTEIMIWGLQFIHNEKNKHLKFHRNKIMRYVTERQRELMFK